MNAVHIEKSPDQSRESATPQDNRASFDAQRRGRDLQVLISAWRLQQRLEELSGRVGEFQTLLMSRR